MGAKKKKVAVVRLERIDPESLAMLRTRPYEKPRPVHGTSEVETAQELVERGLLERDTCAPGFLARCTHDGMMIAKPLSIAETATIGAMIANEKDRRVAASVRRALWRRVLVEVAADPRVPRELRRIAELTLRTERNGNHR